MILKKYIRSFGFAFAGIAFAFRSQFNMRFHIFTAVAAIILSFVLHVTAIEWCIVFLCIGSVLSAELINTATEVHVDLTTQLRNEKAGQAKDLAAAAVLVVCIVSAIIGSIIFIPKIVHLF